MEATREIYWNIGTEALTTLYLLTALAIAVFIWGMAAQVKTLKLGRPLKRDDQFWKRLAYALSQSLAQSRVRSKRTVGGLHSLFLWGFVVLFIGTTLIFIQADILAPLFGITFLKGSFYLFYSIALDLSGFIALIMILGLAARRYIATSLNLPKNPGDFWSLFLLFVILVTGFLIEGLRIAVTEVNQNPELARFSPLGLLVAKSFAGVDARALRGLHAQVWWVHMVLVMSWIASVPFTRLRHLVLIPLNAFCADLGPKGKLITLDLEDESQETFGAAEIQDLTWKDMLDAEACVQCKRCEDACPAWNTEKPLSPMKVIRQIKELAQEGPTAKLVAKIGAEALWACTTCRACQSGCPAEVEHVPKIIEMRRNLVLMEGQFSGDEVAQAMDQMEVNGNPLGAAPATRADWSEDAEELLVPLNEAEVVYFTGCYASFDARNQKVAKNLIQLAKAAGVKLAILGKGEKCCGEPARKMGNEYLYQALAAENIASLQAEGVKKVVTTCPHCFDTLSKQYPDLGLRIEVEHYASFLDKLVRAGKLKLNPQAESVAYHDSCYLGRYNDQYEAPRQLLAQAGAEVKEMRLRKKESFCCGGGGGRILAEENQGTRINQKRVRMAVETGAKVIASNCPFCLTMFEDGIKGADLEGKIIAQDLSEILVEALASRQPKEKQ